MDIVKGKELIGLIGETIMDRKTHKVIDEIYHEDEGNSVFVGTYDECVDFLWKQGMCSIGMKIVLLLSEEIKIYNKEK